jgi:hypothetical protein
MGRGGGKEAEACKDLVRYFMVDEVLFFFNE